MGGTAFEADPSPLRTPRMPRTVYESVKSRCHTILMQYYTYVATPIEAPEKEDYGDVDFLVACPTQPCLRSSNIVKTIAKALGAERSIAGKGSSTANFALPWPKELQGGAPVSYLSSDESEADIFVQVDVHVCDDKQDWEWLLFLHAHGDLLGILGSIIRMYGLSVDTFGLFLRIEEIEQIDRKRSKILLTKTPSDVLSFLGLDESRCWHQFESAQTMYEYAATCRFFRIYEDSPVNGRDEGKNALEDRGRKSLKKKMKDRRLLRKWVEEFIPQCRALGAYNRLVLLIEQVRDDAFQRFGVKDEYDDKLDTWHRERRNNEMWRNAIIASLPTADIAPTLRTAAIRGLRATIQGDLSYGVIPPSLLKQDGLYDMKALVEFLTREWQRVGAIELEKQHVRAEEREGNKRKTQKETEI